MQRKLLPALYRLARQGLPPEKFRILGVARGQELNDAAFRQWAREALRKEQGSTDAETASWCENCLHYQAIPDTSAEGYRALAKRLEDIENANHLPGHRIFYLALPPSAFAPAIQALGEAGLSKGSGGVRLVIEKPFGRDLESARELNRTLHEYFAEHQVYRIDHYLGKETVQNLLVLRFANTLFESSWNRDRVESVQITVSEDLGVENRAGYYDKAGALRDMVQNHLTQLFTLAAMEPPAAFEADAIRHEKVKVLQSVIPPAPEDVVFGQYSRGELNGKEVPAYREESGVDPESCTETFAALRLEVANWRWQGVPFFLRTGKRLPRRLTQIAVSFHCPPVSIFHPQCQIESNTLLITLQPDQGFDLLFEVKSPGQELLTERQRLHFRYEEVFGPLPEAYETLLFDVMTGDQTLFVRADEVEASWKLYQPLLERDPAVRSYPAGSWGPEETNQLLTREGRKWIIL